MLQLQLLHMTGQTTTSDAYGGVQDFYPVHVAVVSVHQLEHVDDGVRGQLPPPSGSCCSQ